MTVMAIDYGDAHTGIAISDRTGTIAGFSTTIDAYRAEQVADAIVRLVREHEVEELVLGYPKNMDGTLGWRAEECSEIGEKIKEATSLPVVMWDERCTTVSAHTALNFTDTRGKKRKNVVDAVAAVIILEDYLAFKKNKK